MRTKHRGDDTRDQGGASVVSRNDDAAPLPDLAEHFDDPFLSDFQLRLVSAGSGDELARYHVHGIVLAGQSGYFKSLLQNWIGQDARVFDITVTEEELPAAQQMLRAAYANAVPNDAEPGELLSTMILADRYQLRVCVEACKARLLSLESSSINWDTALAMLRLPPGLRECDAFACLAEKAHGRVAEAFQSLDEAWGSRTLRSQWLALPLNAVERLLSSRQLTAASENVVYIMVASWLSAQTRRAGDNFAAAKAARAATRGLLEGLRYPHMSANFLAAVGRHHRLLAAHPYVNTWMLEAMQWGRASESQRREMQGCAPHGRFDRRVGPAPDTQASGSAFTSYIAAADLQQAIAKYRASNCSEAYYLLTAGHFFNGYTWRLKLTVKPPDAGSTNDMNIHVGLCWGIELEGEGALALADSTMVQVDFDIATWDFVLHEEDPTSSEGPVIIRAGTCWGWDDFFGPEIYSDSSLWAKYMTDKQQLLLSCHIYNCA